MKVKTILVSQPAPETDSSPYFDLEKKYKVKVDFKPFIYVEGETSKQVRAQKIDFANYTAILLTSKNAVDHFFRMAEEMRFEIPGSLKYFCQSEAIALYLQKYVAYRKRKIYAGKKVFADLAGHLEKFKEEKFLLISSDKLKPTIPKMLDDLKVNWKKAVLFRTVASDLSDLKKVSYDILVFFSPSGIESLFKNFPDFEQKKTKIAVFGNSTIKAAKAAGLKCDIQAPTPESPSMTMALEKHLEKVNKA